MTKQDSDSNQSAQLQRLTRISKLCTEQNLAIILHREVLIRLCGCSDWSVSLMYSKTCVNLPLSKRPKIGL